MTSGKKEALLEEGHENCIATTDEVEKLVSSYCFCIGHLDFLSISQALQLG